MRILVVEDEEHLAEAIGQILKRQNYTVDIVHDGEAGLDFALTGIYDVMILDIMLPKMNGISVLRELRKKDCGIHVIVLSAKGELEDKVLGLDSGADDYLAKPFQTEELLARIRALGRRKGESAVTELCYGDLQLNMSNLVLTSGRGNITLTLKEAELLEYLMRNGNIVSQKERIIEKIWGFDSEAEANHVEVYISFLRKKLKHVKSHMEIRAIRGLGYMLKEAGGDVPTAAK